MQRDPYVVSEESLVAEAAQATFAFRNKLSAATLRLVWRQLCRFIVGAEGGRELGQRRCSGAESDGEGASQRQDRQQRSFTRPPQMP